MLTVVGPLPVDAMLLLVKVDFLGDMGELLRVSLRVCGTTDIRSPVVGGELEGLADQLTTATLHVELADTLLNS